MKIHLKVVIHSVLYHSFLTVSMLTGICVDSSIASTAGDSCQSGMVSVDHQCVSLGNQANLVFLSVYTVNKSTLVSGASGKSTVEVVGKGYSNSLGGSPASPIPLTVAFSLKDEGAAKNERIYSQLTSCQQSALLSMSGKEKYLFTVNVSGPTSLKATEFTGGNGKYSVYLDPNSSNSHTVQCGNSLKSP
jgi:hypothetical protein